MTRAAKGARLAQVLPMMDGTRTAKEIADEVSCHPEYVWRIARLHKREAKLARERAPAGTVIKLETVRVALPADQAAWLRTNTPQGGTVSDLIRSILVDVMEGEA